MTREVDLDRRGDVLLGVRQIEKILDLKEDTHIVAMRTSEEYLVITLSSPQLDLVEPSSATPMIAVEHFKEL